MGIFVALVTAGVVFGVGVLVLPPLEPPASVIVEPPPPPSPPPPPAEPPPVPEPAEVDAEAPPPDGEPPSTAAAEPEREESKAQPRAKPGPAPAAASAPTAAQSAPPSPPPKDRSADKEVARDAWRKNLPDVSAEAGKAAMLIPIKGSIDGATYHVTAKPRSVLITLPKGESMVTMPFYAVRHDGFRQLWIKKDDQTGTSIRVVLAEASEPQVEIKDEFVRVTVRRPAPAPAATPGPAASSTAPASAAVDAGAAPASRGD